MYAQLNQFCLDVDSAQILQQFLNMRLVNVCLIMILLLSSALGLAQSRSHVFVMPPKLKEFIDQTMYPASTKTNALNLGLNLGIQTEHLEFVTLASRFKVRLKLHHTTISMARLLSASDMQKLINIIEELEGINNQRWLVTKGNAVVVPVGTKKIILPPDWFSKTRIEKTRYIAGILISLATNQTLPENDLDLLLAFINDEEDIQHKINVIEAKSNSMLKVTIDNRINEPYLMHINQKFGSQIELMLVSEKNPKDFYRYFVEFNYAIFSGPFCPTEIGRGFNDYLTNTLYYSQFNLAAKNCFEKFKSGAVPKTFWASGLHQRVFLCLE